MTQDVIGEARKLRDLAFTVLYGNLQYAAQRGYHASHGSGVRCILAP